MKESESELVEIAAVPSTPLAEALRVLLDAEGIKATVASSSHFDPLVRMKHARVLVPRVDAERAQAILAAEPLGLPEEPLPLPPAEEPFSSTTCTLPAQKPSIGQELLKPPETPEENMLLDPDPESRMYSKIQEVAGAGVAAFRSSHPALQLFLGSFLGIVFYLVTTFAVSLLLLVYGRDCMGSRPVSVYSPKYAPYSYLELQRLAPDSVQLCILRCVLALVCAQLMVYLTGRIAAATSLFIGAAIVLLELTVFARMESPFQAHLMSALLLVGSILGGAMVPMPSSRRALRAHEAAMRTWLLRGSMEACGKLLAPVIALCAPATLYYIYHKPAEASYTIFMSWLLSSEDGRGLGIVAVAIFLSSLIVREGADLRLQNMRDNAALEVHHGLHGGSAAFRPFFLYARPFFLTNRLHIREKSYSLAVVDPSLYWHGPTRGMVDFETKLEKALRRYGTFLALGQPGEHVGAGRISSDEASWTEDFKQLAESCALIFIIPSDRTGTRWELQWIRDSGFLAKTVLIMPPSAKDVGDVDVEHAWNRAEQILCDDGIRLPPYKKDGALLALREDGSTVAIAWTLADLKGAVHRVLEERLERHLGEPAM